MSTPATDARLREMADERGQEVAARSRKPWRSRLQRDLSRFDMASNDTFILRAAINGEVSVYRDIEIEPSKSLYKLAEAIVAAFGFDFDHAFGFYSGLKPATMMRKCSAIRTVCRYGRCPTGRRRCQEYDDHTGVSGDRPHHDVSVRLRRGLAPSREPESRRCEAGEVVFCAWSRRAAMLPRNTRTPDEIDEDDRPTYGINPVTGEKICFRR